jgi:hypothetical protein
MNSIVFVNRLFSAPGKSTLCKCQYVFGFYLFDLDGAHFSAVGVEATHLRCRSGLRTAPVRDEGAHDCWVCNLRIPLRSDIFSMIDYMFQTAETESGVWGSTRNDSSGTLPASIGSGIDASKRQLSHPHQARAIVNGSPRRSSRQPEWSIDKLQYEPLSAPATINEKSAPNEQEQSVKRSISMLLMLCKTCTRTISTSEISARCARNHPFWI